MLGLGKWLILAYTMNSVLEIQKKTSTGFPPFWSTIFLIYIHLLICVRPNFITKSSSG